VVIVLGDEECHVDDAHLLLQTWMERRAGDRSCSEFLICLLLFEHGARDGERGDGAR